MCISIAPAVAQLPCGGKAPDANTSRGVRCVVLWSSVSCNATAAQQTQAPQRAPIHTVPTLGKSKEILGSVGLVGVDAGDHQGQRMESVGTRQRNPPHLHLSLEDFVDGCASYLRRYSSLLATDAGCHEPGPQAYSHTWEWVEHEVRQLSGLTRQVEFFLPTTKLGTEVEADDPTLSTSDGVHDCDDETTAQVLHGDAAGGRAHVTQTITYSSTWHVPVLWVDGWVTDAAGAVRALTIDDVLEMSCCPHKADGSASNTLKPLLRADHKDDESEADSDVGSRVAAYFPPVTLADHPTSGRPSMFLHPCQTAQVVGEMLEELDIAQGDGEFGRRYLEAFMAICASAIEMRNGGEGSGVGSGEEGA